MNHLLFKSVFQIASHLEKLVYISELYILEYWSLYTINEFWSPTTISISLIKNFTNIFEMNFSENLF